MKYFISWCVVVVCCFATTPIVDAQIINLTVDPTQSTSEFSILGSTQQSSTSGTGTLELIPPTEPFGTAQIQELNVILDDAMNFSFFFGLVTASTTGGDVMVDLLVPGPAGDVGADTHFDQLGNLIATSGTLDVVDPLNLAGGSQSIDLSTLDPFLVDFSGVMLSRVGNTVTIEMEYAYSQDIDAGGTIITVDVTGSLVASGSAEPPAVVPEGMKLHDGVIVAGAMSDLFARDDQYLGLDPSPTKNLLKQRIHLIVQSTSTSALPTDFKFRLESMMLGGPSGDVIQTVELFNYTTGQLELVDTRAAANSDESVEITPAGDLSRFIKPITNEMTTHIIWRSESFAGAPFTWSIDVDETVWLVTD